MTDSTAALGKFRAIEQSMRDAFQERGDVIRLLLVAAVAQEHIVLLGPPGTGKSALTRALTSCIGGAHYYETLLSRYTTEDDLCGPVKLSAFKQDRYERATTGMLPEAEVAFLDETFKANAATLNSLLSILNERLFKGTKVPMRMCCGASNEMPEDESLGALWDRFLLREVVSEIQGEGAWIDMMKASRRRTAKPFRAPCVLSIAEWDAARDASLDVEIPDALYETLAAIKAAMAKDGLKASDRRWNKAQDLIQAHAWLSGRAVATADDVHVLRAVLWSTPDQAARVAAILTSVERSEESQVQGTLDAALRAYGARPANPRNLREAAPALVDKLDQAAKAALAAKPRLSTAAVERLRPDVRACLSAKDAIAAEIAQSLRAGDPRSF